MCELKIAQELFLVLFSILYGVMLQSLFGLQPFPLGRTLQGFVSRHNSRVMRKSEFHECLKVFREKNRIHYENLYSEQNNERFNRWLRCMWRKRVCRSFFILNFCPMVYFFYILSLLDAIPISLNWSSFLGLFFIFWSALSVFGFYRFYIALTVLRWDSLFCDVVKKLEERGTSFDARAHILWGLFYLLPPTIFFTILFLLT